MINGVRWATRNVDMPGTFAETPESVGMFFQWNRKKAWNAVDERVEGWDMSIPTGTAWYAENDPCPPGWRVPTADEWESLRDIESHSFIENGVSSGRLFSTTPRQLYLPRAGRRFADGSRPSGTTVTHYWSSTPLHNSTMSMAFQLGGNNMLIANRAIGASVRCVSIDSEVVVPEKEVSETAIFDEGVVINGIRWATRNVDISGTFAETPECFGMLFQWNRRRTRYRYWDSSVPEGTAWYAENDPCPQGWRVPTREELQSLERAGSEWVTRYGVGGRLFGTAPYQIFLPAAGLSLPSGSIRDVNTTGSYWSSTTQDEGYPMLLWFTDENVNGNIFSNLRTGGLSVRCVAVE